MSETKNHTGNAEIEARRKTLVALAISLGVDKTEAGLRADALLGKADAYAHLHYEGVERRALEPNIAEQIDAIGSAFLKGSGRDRLQFTVGCRVLSLLRERLDGDYLTNVEGQVAMWTDGARDSIFRRLMKKNKA